MTDFPNRLELLEEVFNASNQLMENSRVGDGQSCNTSMMEYLVPTNDVKRLWYAVETLKAYDKQQKEKHE